MEEKNFVLNVDVMIAVQTPSLNGCRLSEYFCMQNLGQANTSAAILFLTMKLTLFDGLKSRFPLNRHVPGALFFEEIEHLLTK